MFCKAILALRGDSLTCYIDALDECDGSEIRDMIEVFEELTELATSKQIQFRICFSSRHHPRITMAKYQEGHENDITVYIRNKFRVPLSERSKFHIAKQLQQRASGIFLWVVLVIGILNIDADRGHAHKLKARLQEILIDSKNLFQDIILRGTQEDNYLVPVLQWIMVARRPLRCEELYQAIMQTPAARNENEEVYQTSPANMENLLLNSSKGFAELT